MALNIVLIFGSVRDGRLGIHSVPFLVGQMKSKGHTVVVVDPAEYKLPLLEKRYKDYPQGQAPSVLSNLSRILEEADAYLLVTGEYNHSVPAALKNLLDHFFDEYKRKPSAMVSYSVGPFGGIRAAIHLREILAELGAVAIPPVFAIPQIQNVFDEKGNLQDAAYEQRFAKFLSELEWYASALKSARGEPAASSSAAAAAQ